MTSAGDSESVGDLSQSWPDTEPIGSPDEPSPQSPALAVRRTFSHYTQVRHNGYLTKRFKLTGTSAPWSRQFCTVHGNVLRCFAGKVQYGDGEDPVETSIIRGVRPWQAEFNKPYNRGLLIDCEGGDTIIARTDTSAEQEEWSDALGTVTELMGTSRSRGGGGGRGGGGFGGERSDDSDIDVDDSDDGSVLAGGGGAGARIQTTYLAQKDELLSREEAAGPCVVVFQVAKTTLQRVDEPDTIGRFNNGDVYLVMHARVSTESLTGGEDGGGGPSGVVRTLFYWVGSKASMDKGTVACIKAVELRRALSGACTIRREDEGQESPEFLVLFDEVTVADEESGARVLSKVQRWNELPPLMYSVRLRQSASGTAFMTGEQRRQRADHSPTTPQTPSRRLHSSFTVGRIDLDEDHLSSEGVLLVDDRNGHVYLWCGQLSTFKHRGFGLEAAAALKADNPKGGQVVQVDEDDEPPELRRILDRARKQRLLELQVRAAEGDEEGAEAQGAEQRRLSLMGASAEGTGPAVSLFRVTQEVKRGKKSNGGWGDGGGKSDGDARLELSLIACTSKEYISEILGNELESERDENPMMSMLESNAAYILDVFTEVFVWYGNDAERAARRGAGKVAHQLLRAVARPKWAEHITHVREAREPFLFRVKFFDWGVARRMRDGVDGQPINCISMFHKNVRTIAEVKHDPVAEVERRARETLEAGEGKDLPSPADAVVDAVGAGWDEGYGELLMWRVHPRGLVTVPEEEFGHMQSSHSYVLLYGYDAAAENDFEEDEDDDSDDDSEDSTGLTKTGGDINKRGSYSRADSRYSSRGSRGQDDDECGGHDQFDDDDDDDDEDEDEECYSDDSLSAYVKAADDGKANGETERKISGGGKDPDRRAGVGGSLSPGVSGGGGGRGRPSAAALESSANRRKSMFATVKRESLAGGKTLQEVRGHRQRGLRSSLGGHGEEIEELERIVHSGVFEEGDEDDEDEDIPISRRLHSNVTSSRGTSTRGKGSRNSAGTSATSSRRNNNIDTSKSQGQAAAAQNSDGDDGDDYLELSSMGSGSGASDLDGDLEDGDDVDGQRGPRSRGKAALEGSETEDEDYVPGAEPRFLIYFWAGSRSKKSDWVLWKLELAKTMVPEWQKAVKAEIPQIQVLQGQEPLHFRRIFGQGRDNGRLIVHDRVWRKRDNPEKRVSLFKVQRVADQEFQTFQVPPSVGSLSSMHVYVVICTVVTDDWVGNNDEAVFFWVGKHATLDLQEHGAKVLMALMEYYCMPADFKVHILEEDELWDEHAALWDNLAEMLGGEATWAHWEELTEETFDCDEDLLCVPKLYVMEAGIGGVVLTYQGAVQQIALSPEAVAVLDAVDGVYVWRGSKADSGQWSIIYRACEAYCPRKTLPVGRRVIGVQEGQEPLVFRARFDAWDDGAAGVSKVFQDVYDKRVEQMSKEGTLGDMRGLRGRVLDDDEAAQFWKDRAAEPGGVGVKEGVSKDDPASRALQRRGAPGRKPWVKPKPKPKPDEKKVEKLENKRNFMSLKEKFEGSGAEAFWADKPVRPAFNRQSMLRAREESIRAGHVNQFHAPRELERRERRARVEQVTEQAARESWGSTSSVRRKTLQAASIMRTSSFDRASPPPTAKPTRMASPDNSPPTSTTPPRDPSTVVSVSRPSRPARRGSTDTAAGSRTSSWEADPDGRPGNWRKRGGTGRKSLDSAAGSATSEPEADQNLTEHLSSSRPLSGAVGEGGNVEMATPAGHTTPGDMMRVAFTAGPEAYRSPGYSSPSTPGRDTKESTDVESREGQVRTGSGDASDGGAGGGMGISDLPRMRLGSQDEMYDNGGDGIGYSGGGELRGSREVETKAREKDKRRISGPGRASPLLSREEVIMSRWSGTAAAPPRPRSARPGDNSGGSQAVSSRNSGGGVGNKSRPKERARARSGSIVGNEELLGALEQAEKEERRLSNSLMAPVPSTAAAAAAAVAGESPERSREPSRSRTNPSAQDGAGGYHPRSDKGVSQGDTGGHKGSRRSRSSRGGSGEGKKQAAVAMAPGDAEKEQKGSKGPERGRDRDSTAVAYRRALAKVRHETVQEGLRLEKVRQKAGGSGSPGQESDVTDSPSTENPTPKFLSKPRQPVRSIKHAMSRVKDQSHNVGRMVYSLSTRGEGLSSGDSPNGRDGGNGDVSISEASIAVGRQSAESAMDDGGEDEDVDSPRNRGRVYDDRWKAPGHAESVLAKFVERLEENRVAHHVPGDEGTAAALAEARANRGAAMSVLSPSRRPGEPASAGAGRGGGSSSTIRAGSDSRTGPVGVAGGGVVDEGALAKPLRYEKEAPALSKAALKKKKRTSTGQASGERSGAGRGTGAARRKKSMGSGRPAARRTDVVASHDRSTSRQFSGGRNVGVEGGGGGGTGSGLGSSVGGGAWSRFGSIAVQQLQRAAEALVGTPRDTVETAAAERAGQERTREAATSYLAASSSGRRRAHEKE